MSQFFISCKESKIENNRSFYGCFNIGPFEPSQSITIANALRRTLLSELYGLSIVSVEMEGVTHEYSNIKGVKDSVLDILLNLKDIVLKKTINTIGIKPQVGYLKIRGPGVVRAGNLKLPPFIQSVDPDQYIATLTHDGFLDMKFIIQYSNKWLSNQNFQSNNHLDIKTKDYLNKEEIKSQKNLADCNSEFFLHLKKRRLILKKLRQIGLKNSNLYINIFSKFIYKQSKKITIDFLYFNSYYPNKKNNQENNQEINKINSHLVNQNYKSPWTSYLQVPALKLLKIKTNNSSYAEKPQFFEIQKKRKIFQAITALVNKHSNKYPAINLRDNRILNNFNKVNTQANKNSFQKNIKKVNLLKKKINKFSNFFNSIPLTIDSIFNPVTKVNYIIEVNDYKISQAQFAKSNEILELLELLNVSKTETRLNDFNTNFIGGTSSMMQVQEHSEKNSSLIIDISGEIDYQGLPPNSISNNISKTSSMSITKNSIFLENILEIKQDINFLKKETPKHNIIFEIWTNGSMHPRDAIYQGFKNLVRIFSKLNKINSFMINPLTLSSLENNSLNNKEIKKKNFLKRIKRNQIGSTISDPLMLSTETANLTSLNDGSFLSTYMGPKLKNFYFKADTNKWGYSWSQAARPEGTPSKIMQAAAWSLPTMQAGQASGIKYQQESNALNTNTQSETSNSESLGRQPGHGGPIFDNQRLYSQIIKSKSLKNNKLNMEQDIGILHLSLRSFSTLKRLNINTIKELKLFLTSNNKSLNFKKLSKICLEEIELSLQKLE